MEYLKKSNTPSFPNYLCINLNFPPIFQLNILQETKSQSILLAQTLMRFAKMQIKVILLTFSFRKYSYFSLKAG